MDQENLVKEPNLEDVFCHRDTKRLFDEPETASSWSSRQFDQSSSLADPAPHDLLFRGVKEPPLVKRRGCSMVQASRSRRMGLHDDSSRVQYLHTVLAARRHDTCSPSMTNDAVCTHFLNVY